MTAALLDRATTRPPATRQTPRSTKPKLRVLDQAARRRRARHRSALLILFVAVLLGFFAVAFVHAELVAGQHDLDAVRTEISQAEARHAELARAVEEASAPGVIVTRATELGMVRARQPVYLAAAAPIRTVDVSPSLAIPITADHDVDGSTVVQVAAGQGTESDVDVDTDRLHGSLGVAGGISAAVRVPSTPSVAIGVGPSPAGASTVSVDRSLAPSSPTVPATTGESATGEATASGPVASIAGSRAVTSPTVGVVGQPNQSTTAGGLASAAATTSG